MRTLISLPVSVNAWNAIKFVLLESVVSLVFAPLWIRYIRSTCHRMVEKEKGSATVFSSEIGRLTPASIMVYRNGDTINICSRPFSRRLTSRTVLLFINLFLLGSLLVAEYGSGSRRSYKVIRANVTDVRKHSGLVAAIAKNELPASSLTPLALAPPDYSYSIDQSSVILKRRVRTLKGPMEIVLEKNADRQSKEVLICGISSTSAKCKNFFGYANHSMLPPGSGDPPKFFQVGKVKKISALFKDAPAHLSFASGIREVGEGFKLYSNPKNYTMDCIMEDYYVRRSDYHSYELNFLRYQRRQICAVLLPRGNERGICRSFAAIESWFEEQYRSSILFWKDIPQQHIRY